MGAWGSGNLQNDTASDWVYELFEPGDHLPMVETAVRAAAEAGADDALDTVVASCALAASEVIAAWLGRPGADVNDTVTVWARAQSAKGPPADELVAAARTATTRVRERSELRNLWEEGESFTEWTGVVDGLLERLG